MTTDTQPEGGRRARHGFTVGGMAKGSGMIHPKLATMLAVVTTDYPLEPGEAIEFLRPAVDDELQRDLRRRRVLDERHRRAARERRERRRAHAGERRRVRALRCRRCAATSRRRSSPTARARPCSPRSTSRGAASEPEARAIARARRDLAAREDGALRARRELGPVLAAAGSAPFNGGFAELDPDRVSICSTACRCSSHGAPPGDEPDARRPTARSSSISRSATATAAYLTTDLSYDYVRINAEYRT